MPNATAGVIPSAAGPLRALFANHNDGDASGGGGQVLHETVAALRALGVDAAVTSDLEPDVAGYDVVHAFNVWPPETALAQMRHLATTGAPIVWQPIFSDLVEFSWALRAMRLLCSLTHDSSDWCEVLEGFVAGTLVVDGVARRDMSEIVPGYLTSVAEMLALADHVSVCSLHEIGMLARTAPEVQPRFSVIPHGVSAELFASADPAHFVERYGVHDFLLCVGSVEPRKNQLLLVEAARSLDRPVVLIGPTHPGEGDYLANCELLGGDQVIYTGPLPRDLVASAYKAAAVHVLPSFAEGSALSTMEAAAAGCPIVASNRGSEFEYYGDLVVTCDPLSPHGIAQAIDAALERQAGQQLAAHMRSFPWSRTAEATLAAYRVTLAEAANPTTDSR